MDPTHATLATLAMGTVTSSNSVSWRQNYSCTLVRKADIATTDVDRPKLCSQHSEVNVRRRRDICAFLTVRAHETRSPRMCDAGKKNYEFTHTKYYAIQFVRLTWWPSRPVRVRLGYNVLSPFGIPLYGHYTVSGP